MASHGQAAAYYNNADAGGYNGFDQGYQKQQGAYQQGAYQQGAYQQGAYQQGAYQQPPYQQSPYQQPPYQEPVYNAPAPNYNQPSPNQDKMGEKQSFDQAFHLEKPKFNDIWAGALFLAVVAGLAVITGITVPGYIRHKDLYGSGIYNGVNRFGLNSNTAIMFAFILGAAVVLSVVYIWLARLFTKQFIWVTGILNICFNIVLTIYLFYRRQWAGGIIFALFAVLTILAFISWIPRIPFSVLMLQTAIDVSKNYGHVYLVSILGGLIGAAFAAWYSITLIGIYTRYTPNPQNPSCADGGCSNAKVIGLVVFATFAIYWITEWLKNTIHATISGVYGSWYFNSHAPAQKATRGALKRSLTYSFGSISFGSLVVAIIQFLRMLCSVAQSNAAGDDNVGLAILFCFLRCLIGLVEWAVEFINRYAFSYMALYGKAYIASAKSTWRMIKDRGIDALINECLIGPVLGMGGMFIGFACALLGFLYITLTDPSNNQGGAYSGVAIAYGFLIGTQICHIFTTPLSSGIDTIFVASAVDPQVLMRDHPDLYQRMVAVYPHVQQAIHA